MIQIPHLMFPVASGLYHFGTYTSHVKTYIQRSIKNKFRAEAFLPVEKTQKNFADCYAEDVKMFLSNELAQFAELTRLRERNKFDSVIMENKFHSTFGNTSFVNDSVRLQ